jgi:hypothetical protein
MQSILVSTRSLKLEMQLAHTPVRFKMSGSSKSWMQRHVNDHYVKMAEQEGNRSRAQPTSCKNFKIST